MGALGAHPKDNGVNKGVQVITTDQKKAFFFRSDHEAMKMLKEKIHTIFRSGILDCIF